MNKCIETFAHYCDDEGIISEQYKEEIVEVWQAAWNAALEYAANVCDSKETEWDNEDRAQSAAAFLLAEAIRKEKQNDSR